MAVATGIESRRWSVSQRAAVSASVVVGLVARWWALGSSALSFDESFTDAYARLPVGDIPAALRANDSHPPADYLLRHVLTGAHSAWLLRAPSAVFATLALLAVVVWMRRRSWFGVGVVAAFALDPFQLLYGRQARMYALLCLLGVVVAMLSERWLRGDRRRLVLVGLTAALALACLDHAGGLFLAAGVFTLPALGRSRDDWLFRAAPLGAVALWALLWARPFLDQVEVASSSWVPLTTPHTVAGTVAGLVTFVAGTGWVVAPLVFAGGACLWVVDRALGRLWVSLFLVPLVLLALVGLHSHVLLSRTLAGSSWAAPVALVALVQVVASRWAAVGAVVGALVALLILRSLPQSVTFDEGFGEPVAAAVAGLAPGDGLLVHPSWWWPLATWNGATGGHPGAPLPPALQGVDGWYWVRPGGAATGITWVLHPESYRFDTSRWPPCGAQEHLGNGWILDCVVTGGS